MIVVTLLGGPEDGRTLVMSDLGDIVVMPAGGASMAIYSPETETLRSCACCEGCPHSVCRFVFTGVQA